MEKNDFSSVQKYVNFNPIPLDTFVFHGISTSTLSFENVLKFCFFHFCLPKPIPARGIRIESTPRASSAFKILVQKIFQYAMEHLKNADIGRKRTNMHHIPME